MAEQAGAGESGGSGEASQGLSVTIPETLATDDHFKGFFKEGGDGSKSFDFDSFSTAYKEAATKLSSLPGVPEAYKFDIPKDYALDEVDVKTQQEIAKAAGMTQAQYEAMVKHDLARIDRAAELASKELQAAKQKLGSEWKGDFEKNIGLAKKASDAIFGPDFANRVDLGNDIDLIRGLYTIAKKMGEDIFRQGGAPMNDNRPMGVDGRPRLKFPSMGDK